MFYYSRKDSYTVHRCHDIVQSLFITTIRIQFVNLFFFFCFHSCLHSPNPTSSLIFLLACYWTGYVKATSILQLRAYLGCYIFLVTSGV